MSIPDYIQEISDFRSPNGHRNEADFVAEGLTTLDAATGDLKWIARERKTYHIERSASCTHQMNY